MKVQSVGNSVCQRKNDINFSAILLNKKATRLVDAIFPDSLHSVSGVLCELRSSQRGVFLKNLFLTEKERRETVRLSCEAGVNPYSYLLGLQEEAKRAGVYSVSRIRKAIEGKTFLRTKNLRALKGSEVVSSDELKIRLEGYLTLGKRIKTIENRHVVPQSIKQEMVLAQG